MGKFRKKPVVIEAIQFFFDSRPWPEGVRLRSGVGDQDVEEVRTAWIGTLEGPHVVSDGDWIITGVNGERYPCKDEIFRLTYEKMKSFTYERVE